MFAFVALSRIHSPRMPRSLRALWTCPQCGHRFVGRNMWHSCVNVPIAAHFKGKPQLRKAFDKYVALARQCARTRITVYAQKSRIVFQARARYAGCTVRKDFLEGGIWLKRRLEHPRIHRILQITPRDFGHYFRLRTLADIDHHLARLLREAYKAGMQEHLLDVGEREGAWVRKRAARSPKNSTGRTHRQLVKSRQ